MGIFSSDKKTTTTSIVTTIGLENIEGPAVVGDSNVVTYTDQGSIAAAHDLGLEALRLGQSNLTTAADLAGRAVDAGGQATRDALAFGGDVSREAFGFGGAIARDALGEVSRANERSLAEVADFGHRSLAEISTFGGRAIGEVADVSGRALGEVSSFGDRAITALSDAQAGVLDFARDLFGGATAAQEKLVSSNIEGLTGLARQTSESADDRVTRVVGYLALAAAAAFVLPAILRR